MDELNLENQLDDFLNSENLRKDGSVHDKARSVIVFAKKVQKEKEKLEGNNCLFKFI